LSAGMRQLNGVYTQWVNRQHQRVGHVFQGRYRITGSGLEIKGKITGSGLEIKHF